MSLVNFASGLQHSHLIFSTHIFAVVSTKNLLTELKKLSLLVEEEETLTNVVFHIKLFIPYSQEATWGDVLYYFLAFFFSDSQDLLTSLPVCLAVSNV